MAASTVPALIDALVVTMTSIAPDFTVSDGFPIELNSGDYIAVGVDDPDSRSPAPSATSDREWVGATRQGGLTESVEITCAAWAHRGDMDAKSARDSVSGALVALEDYLRDGDGIRLFVQNVLYGWVSSTRLEQNQDQEQGATALLVFRVAFRARI